MSSQAVTPYQELNEVLTDLVSSLRGVLGEAVVGVYLQGSFAVGDFDENSDLDFIVILSRDLLNEEVSVLNQMHTRIYHSGPEWAKHLEGSYFTLEDIAADPGKPVCYLDHGSIVLERSNHCNTLVVREVLYKHGVALHGPPASSVVPAVEVDALRHEMAATLTDWGSDILANPEPYRNRFYQGFIVLNYCRMLCDHEAGTVGSKRGGAEWAKKNLPAEWHDLIDRSWSCRPDPATSSRTLPDEEDFRRALEFVGYCIDRLSSARTGL